MMNKNIELAEGYYQAMRNKDINKMALYLHPKVHFLGALAEINGKESVLAMAEERFFPSFNDLKLRAKCANNAQVMLAYDLICPAPIGTIRVAALLSFEQELIIDIELFFDARPFTQK